MSVESELILTTSPHVNSSNNCTFAIGSENLLSKIGLQMEGYAKLLVINIPFSDWSGNISFLEQGNIYKPTQWVIARGRSGKQFLLLRHNFEILSLSTLSLNIRKMDISMIQSPPNCIEKMNVSTFEIAVRYLLLNSFKTYDTGDDVCYSHISDNNGNANFIYQCCSMVRDNTIQCDDLTRDIWLTVVLYIADILKWCVFLVSARFVPSTLYAVKHHKYTLRLRNKSVNLNVLVTKTPTSHLNARIITDLSKLKNMPRLTSYLQNLRPDFVHNLKITDIMMKIKEEQLIAQDNVPVGLLKSLYTSFVRCKIRKHTAVSECCYQEFCWIPWHKILRKLMSFFVILLVISPSIVAVYIYWNYERHDIKVLEDAASQRGLRPPTPPSGVTYMIVIYAALIIECIALANKRIKQICLFVFKKCFRDMRDTDVSYVFEKSISILLKPVVSCRYIWICFGMIYWIFALPIVILYISLYLFPTVNLAVRVFSHLLSLLRHSDKARIMFQYSGKVIDTSAMNDTEGGESLLEIQTLPNKKQKTLYFIISLLCFITIECFLLIVIEIVPFLVDMALYMVLGIILNGNTAITYVTLIFLLVMYADSCFSHIANRYMNFNKTINTFLLKLTKGNVSEGNDLPEVEQLNVAKLVEIRAPGDPVSLIKTESGHLSLRTSALVLFRGKNYKSSIPRKLFFDACKMPHYSCPGKRLLHYQRACGEFIVIVLFLLFVLFVVLSFGETNQLSSTTQLLATLAGGIMPWILKTVMSLKRDSSSLKPDKSNFKICLYELLDKYKQDWPIDDIVVQRIEDVSEDGGEGMAGTTSTNNTFSPKCTDENDKDGKYRKNSPESSLPQNAEACITAKPIEIDLMIINPDVFMTNAEYTQLLP